MDVTPSEFKEVQNLVRSLCGLILTDDKTYLVRTRLEPVLKAHGCLTFADYLTRLRVTHEVRMRDELVEALTTGETSFNRDGHLFEELRRRILPQLAELIRRRRADLYPITNARIWSAGCSTGQEPYSLAIAVQDFLVANPAPDLKPEHFPILATDVSQRSLQIAKDGRYSSRELDRGLTPDERTRYFQPQGDDWVVRDFLRKQIEFRRLNFIDPIVNQGPFDLICCRNVMIYFDAPTRQRLCNQFYELLMPGGMLILGAAESLYGMSTPLLSTTIGNTVVYVRPT